MIMLEPALVKPFIILCSLKHSHESPDCCKTGGLVNYSRKKTFRECAEWLPAKTLLSSLVVWLSESVAFYGKKLGTSGSKITGEELVAVLSHKKVLNFLA
jgi:hypothetical protein